MPAESLKEMKMHHFVVAVGLAGAEWGGGRQSNQRKTQIIRQCIVKAHTHTAVCYRRGKIAGGSK